MTPPKYVLDENGIPQLLPEASETVTLQISQAILSKINATDLRGRAAVVYAHQQLRALFPEHIREQDDGGVSMAIERARAHFVDAPTSTFDGYFYERVLVLAIIDVFGSRHLTLAFPHWDKYPVPRWHVSMEDRKPSE